jgi:hypothetical protein
MRWTQAVGWVGMISGLLAYFLLANGVIISDSVWYHILNLMAAVGVGISVYVQKVWPAVVLNVVWGGIAIVSLYKLIW